jgi:hypothetical protein
MLIYNKHTKAEPIGPAFVLLKNFYFKPFFTVCKTVASSSVVFIMLTKIDFDIFIFYRYFKVELLDYARIVGIKMIF